jgi:RNA polymerase sigma-70 factor (ECF subfamily)
MLGDEAPSVDWSACLVAQEGWLRKVILARTGERQAVDEVFQQVAVAAVEQRAPLADPAKAGPWLHRLAVVYSARYRRACGRERRAMRGVAERQIRLENGYADDVLALVLAREREERTRAALSRLRGADAEMLMLKYGERWSCREIARRLGISDKAVECRLARARARLRRELLESGIDETG